MIERLALLSKAHHVSGCENQMIEYLKDFFSNKGFSIYTDLDGCVVTEKMSSCVASNSTIMIAVPLDVPGFLALHCDLKKAHLAKTGTLNDEDIMGESISNENGAIFSLEHEKDSKEEIFVTGENIRIGDSFQLSSKLKITAGRVSGWFSSRLALLSMLLSLSNQVFYHRVLFAFVGSSATRATKEINLIRRFQPDHLILLGSMEKSTNDPIILAKDGRAFSDSKLLSKIQRLCQDEKIRHSSVVSAQETTKLTSVVSETSIPVLSLALPCKNKDKKNESFSIRTLEKFKILLTEYLMNK